MPEITREQIVEAARSYIGVPYVAGGQSRETGLNCAGLIVCVAHDLGLTDVEFPGKSNFTKEDPLDELFGAHLDKLDDWKEAQAGDVLSVAYESDPHHCGFVSKVNQFGVYFIHATRNHGIIEHRLYGKLLRSIAAGYRVRGLKD
jgi:cell wall-associated NlpC family hydrolase